MSIFHTRLAQTLEGNTHAPTRWVFVPYDQLHKDVGPLQDASPRDTGVVFVETPVKPRRRPYHKQKLALILANMRHFALELAAEGFQVRYISSVESYDVTLAALHDLHPLRMAEPAEFELRRELAPLVDNGTLLVSPHRGWLTSDADFRESQPNGPPWRMDAFYRRVRKRTGILMNDGKPVGGKFSFDAQNRQPWRGDPPAPAPPRFVPDEITREAAEHVESMFGHHPGRIVLDTLPATAQDAETLWQWALEQCLKHFGPFEDAMSSASPQLFHTLVSSVLNLHRVMPTRVLGDVVAADLPLQSQEAFVRQVLGWREFVRHVHTRTDGFRKLRGVALDAHGQAAPSKLGAHQRLPPAFWGAESGLQCLDHVVEQVWSSGYSHHITRLMVLGNIATLLDVEPRELADWFWVAYTDAYDWVVEPNVLGMATYGTGDLLTTKPYVSGANYIAKMSDYCRSCAFDPASTCPLTPLYWAFLDRHADQLAGNPRLALPLAALRGRAPARRAHDAEVFLVTQRALSEGTRLRPEDLPVARKSP